MSNVEIRYFRTALKEVIASGRLQQLQRIHVIRPVGAFRYDGSPMAADANETLIPATQANPEHIYQITTAILRELLPDSELKKIKIHDCRFDNKCVSPAVASGGIALTQGSNTDPVPAGKHVAIVDLRLAEPGPPQMLSGRNFEIQTDPESLDTQAELVFDHNIETYLRSTNGFPVRLLKVDSECRALAAYEFTAHGFPDQMPRAWRLSGRHSPLDDWQLIDQRRDIGSWGVFESKRFELRSRSCFRELKFEFLESDDGPNLEIAEIQLLDQATDVDSKESQNIDIVDASSTMPPYGAEGLLTGTPPGWHAARPAKYPQVLIFSLSKTRQIRSVSFLPQEGNSDRGPKRIEVQISKDRRHWDTVDTIVDACGPSSMWSEHSLPRVTTARFVKLVILANCGHSELLTLQGVKFSE